MEYAAATRVRDSRVKIDVIFDTTCPWCFIGKRRLESVLAQRQGVSVALRWRPFLINPDIPENDIDRRLYLDEKFGHESRAARLFDAIRHAGEHVGIPFAFERITRIPATADSHRLIRLATRNNRQMAAVEALFTAYFLEGADIGARDVLCRLGAGVGLDPKRVGAHLDSKAGLPAVFRASAGLHRLGIHGVPCFIFNDAYAVAGAQDTEVLLRLFDLAAQHAPVLQEAPPLSASASCVDPPREKRFERDVRQQANHHS